MTELYSRSRFQVDQLYIADGIARACSPQKTLQLAEEIGRAIGVTRVANVTHLDKLRIPVALAMRPNSRLLATAQGKGVTSELAKISALMESIRNLACGKFTCLCLS